MSLPAGRNGNSKTKSLQFEEFSDCMAWWDHRDENERAWKVLVEQIIKNGYNLGIKNPTAARQDLERSSPDALIDGIVAKERRILDLLSEIKSILAAETAR